MKYIESNLIKDEEIVLTTRLHKIVLFGKFWWAWMIVIGILTMAQTSLIFTFGEEMTKEQYAAGIIGNVVGFAIFSLPAWIPGLVAYITNEFGVTNRRVLSKRGFIARDVFDTTLKKVEGCSMNQSVLGRILNYGTLYITGTGGKRNVFKGIPSPQKMMKEIQERLEF